LTTRYKADRRRRLLLVLEEKGVVVEEDADGRGYSRRGLTLVEVAGMLYLGTHLVALRHYQHKIHWEVPRLSNKLLKWPLLKKIVLV
jgi:hypothetical protein